MISIKKAEVIEIINERDKIQELVVLVRGKREKAINYIDMVGKCRLNDKVILNTTAVVLGLGTGGYHFIMSILDTKDSDLVDQAPGHIMKMRYTPMQFKCYTMEEMYPDVFNSFLSLEKMPIILMPLHSMLPAILASIKENNPAIRIGYIMTEGGALPISFSDTVREMKKLKLLDVTITSGNSFGGDFESVNIYTALIGGKVIAKCDILIVGIGPGHVGTSTTYGFTGIEQGQQIDVVNALGGLPIFIPRISCADPRKRHAGISHHTITNLSKICFSKAIIGIAESTAEIDSILEVFTKNHIDKKHTIIRKNEDTINVLMKNNIHCFTMGREAIQDIVFFQTAGACALLALDYLL